MPNHFALKGQPAVQQGKGLFTDTKDTHALKGQNIITQDNVLSKINIMIISPVRA
jgi:hypothetical protein